MNRSRGGPASVWRLTAVSFGLVALAGCAGAGVNLGVSVPIGPHVGVGVSVGSDGRIGTSVGVSVGGGQVSVGTSGRLPPSTSAEKEAQPAKP